MDRGRRVVARSQGERERPEHLRPGPVWGADGPVPVYRVAALGDAALPGRRGGVEVLDEDFFMYKEDVDLAWRLRLLGWSAWYEPAALAWHVRTVRAGRPVPLWVRVVSWRNQHLMQVKNESLAAFVRDAPWILAREVLTLGHMILTDAPRLRAIPAFLATLPSALRKRRVLWRRVRSRRTGPPRVIDP
jgi:hypothetical protein